jgi:hypothetical protein
VREVAHRLRRPLRPPSSPLVAPAFDDGAFAMRPLLWPLEPMAGPHEIAGTLGEARGDAGGDGRERFHAGIDVREHQGAPVFAVREAVVRSPVATGGFGSLGEWIAMPPLTYVHLRVGRDRRDRVIGRPAFVATRDADGRVTRVRVRRGTRFQTGDVLGTVNRFNHVHLNVGWPGEEHNPLRFRLPGFEDTVPPMIPPGGITVYDETEQRLTQRQRGRLLVRGRVQIVVEAWDRVDANGPRRRLGLYRLGYQVLHADGRPAAGFETPRETMRFDRLAADRAAPALVFAPGSGIPFYGNRATRFLYRVTTAYRDGTAVPGTLDAAALAPGNYILRVLAADVRGNEAIANRDLAITVVGGEDVSGDARP